MLEELKKELISNLRIQEGFVESFGFNLKGGLDLNTQRLGWEELSRGRVQPARKQKCASISVCVDSSLRPVQSPRKWGQRVEGLICPLDEG